MFSSDSEVRTVFQNHASLHIVKSSELSLVKLSSLCQLPDLHLLVRVKMNLLETGKPVCWMKECRGKEKPEGVENEAVEQDIRGSFFSLHSFEGRQHSFARFFKRSQVRKISIVTKEQFLKHVSLLI